jgi:hypothetical protein
MNSGGAAPLSITDSIQESENSIRETGGRDVVRMNEGLTRGSGPAELTLEKRADGQLWARLNGRERAVRVHRCFPWSEPGRFLSLRDDENEEFALVETLDGLGAESRAALDDAMVEAGFVLDVTRIVDVDEEVEIRTWKVETRQGPRSFQTRLDDWPTDVPGGGILIRDVAGDLYHVRNPEDMDAVSRRWLWAFVD